MDIAMIDADSHIVESQNTWDYMDPSDRRYRPTLLSSSVVEQGRPAQSILDLPSARSYWLIDGTVRGLPRTVLNEKQWQELEKATGRSMAVDPSAQNMSSVEQRLRDMDRLGIDIQIVYPTIFLEHVTDKAEVEVALCAAYNRSMADVWKQANGRLRWVCVLPLLSMKDALDQMSWCKRNGAVGVFMRPIEGERLLHDPYFDLLYDEASRQGLCIAVHIGNGNSRERALLSQRVEWGLGFWPFLTPAVGACHAVITSGLMQRHPSLRMGFIECSASWIPWVISDIRRRSEGQKLVDQFLEDSRIYITCYSTDDIQYITDIAGDGVLMIGTDYGHQDMSAELDAMSRLKKNQDVDAEVRTKILDSNPGAFYGI